MRRFVAAFAPLIALGAGALGQTAGHPAPAPTPAELVDRARLMETLGALPAKRSFFGDIEHQRGLAQTEELLAARLVALGLEPRREPIPWNLRERDRLTGNGGGLGGLAAGPGAPETTDELAARTWNNLIVDLPGTDLAREVLIVGAHFDAVPNCPGADDNGTGAAALLELAAILPETPTRRTVRLVFFNLEEAGLKGSAAHVRALRPRLRPGRDENGATIPPAETLVGMLSLEMLGYFSDEPGSQRSPLPSIEGVFEAPTVGDFIGLGTTKKHAEFCRRLDVALRESEPRLKTVVADFVPDFPLAPPDFLRSDHAPFLIAGLPGVMVTDTSNFRNPNYHTRRDSIATIDPERYTMVVRALAGAVHRLAGPVP